MSPSYLKDLLQRGREVRFDYYAKRYVVKLVYYYSTSEYAFGLEWGTKITSSSFDDILYRHDYGFSLWDMIRNLDSSRFDIY